MKAHLLHLLHRLDRLDRALSRRAATADNGSRGLHLLTHAGDGWLWGFLTLLPVGMWRAKAAWGGSLAGVALVVFILKHIVRRTRPRTIAGLFHAEIDAFSFPSGHGARLGVLCAWVLRHRPRFFAPTLLLTLLIGWSRVRLGIHTVGDVLAGWGLGLLVGWVGAAASRGES